MGTSSSVDNVMYKTYSKTIDDKRKDSNRSVDSSSSGYQSVSSSTSKMPPKRQLQQRPSSIVHFIQAQEEDEENKLEETLVKAEPALKKVLEGFETCRNALVDKGNRDESQFEHLDNMLKEKIVQPFNKFSEDEQRIAMANKLARIGIAKVMTEYYAYVIEELDILAVTSAFVDEAHQQRDPGFLLVLTMREILWNFSDSCTHFSEELSKTTIIKYLVEDLDKIYEDGLDELETEAEANLFAFSSAVGILHNCARNPSVDKDVFRKAGVVEKLFPFLQSNLVYVKMITLLALGNIIKEDQVKDLQISLDDIYDFLLEAMNGALKANDRKKHGFHLSELTDGLASLTHSDENKRTIMSKNPLNMIQNILKSSAKPEILAGIRLLWELSFLEENKKIISKNGTLMQTIKSLKSHEDEDIKKNAMNVWFVIEGRDERIEQDEVEAKSQRLASAKKRPAPAEKHPGKHIMISYCWGDKETVLKIYYVLKQTGYKIWIDRFEMGKYGQLLEGMASAVEEAKVILICFSEKYKESRNCRLEAEYAFCLKKPMIPLKLQRGYTPDGWLGALIGVQLFIEFSPKYDFDTKMEELQKRLPPVCEFAEANKNVNSVLPEPKPDNADVPQKPEKRVKDWEKSEVEKWLKEHEIWYLICMTCPGSTFQGLGAILWTLGKVRQLSGKNLYFLFGIMNTAPETFYRWLEDKLNLRSLDDLMKFDNSLRELQPFI